MSGQRHLFLATKTLSNGTYGKHKDLLWWPLVGRNLSVNTFTCKYVGATQPLSWHEVRNRTGWTPAPISPSRAPYYHVSQDLPVHIT